MGFSSTLLEAPRWMDVLRRKSDQGKGDPDARTLESAVEPALKREHRRPAWAETGRMPVLPDQAGMNEPQGGWAANPWSSGSSIHFWGLLVLGGVILWAAFDNLAHYPDLWWDEARNSPPMPSMISTRFKPTFSSWEASAKASLPGFIRPAAWPGTGVRWPG